MKHMSAKQESEITFSPRLNINDVEAESESLWALSAHCHIFNILHDWWARKVKEVFLGEVEVCSIMLLKCDYGSQSF